MYGILREMARPGPSSNDLAVNVVIRSSSTGGARGSIFVRARGEKSSAERRGDCALAIVEVAKEGESKMRKTGEKPDMILAHANTIHGSVK